MDVELDGRTVSAMAYIMTPGHAFGVPSAGYASVIRQGYESAGFDMEVLDNAIDHAFELAQEQEQQRSDPAGSPCPGWAAGAAQNKKLCLSAQLLQVFQKINQ